jgi:hypothetical protein
MIGKERKGRRAIGGYRMNGRLSLALFTCCIKCYNNVMASDVTLCMACDAACNIEPKLRLAFIFILYRYFVL